ncbi:serine protease [Streptomyces sp. 196(2019)]|uniref:S1 family peptidase n=1 Tax=Streptomyces sp. 196(2019) TaxID=2683820 RepID=UPI0013EC94CE|nr:serine protease [Streptomyces sp. 196(2019)]NGO87064.1 trypsin-like serine protease [Streptomyces sp. 196(2019)]
MPLPRPLLAVGLALGMAVAAPAFTGAATAAPNPIVGGGQATTTYSFMGSIQVNGGHYCGASLISPGWMVTALHCTYGNGALPPSALRVRIGSNDHLSGGTLASVSQIVRPSNSQSMPGQDIALLRLSSQVANTPVPITATTPPDNTAIRLLGWGQTCPQRGCSTGAPRYLKQLDTKVLPDSSCLGMVNSRELCIAGTTSNTACYGDSGGPALVNRNGRLELAGATSRSGSNSTTCGVGGAVYTDVAAWRSWIEQYTGAL